MDSNTKKKIIGITLKALSVVLSLIFVLSALGAVAVSGVRRFFNDGKFESLVQQTDLNEVKFMANGKTYTVSEYVYDSIAELLPATLQGYSNTLNSIFGNLVSSTIKGVISNEFVDKIVKETMLDCADFYLESDAKEAKKRLKANEKSAYTANYDDADDIEEAARIYVNSFIINSVENTSGLTSDQIIVLLSKNTCGLLTAVAVISAVLLIICNLSSIFDLLFYFGGSSFLFGIVIKIMQSKFEKAQTDKSLIGYQLLKPLADSYSVNAAIGIIAGILFLSVFLVLWIMAKPKPKSEPDNI